MVGNVRTGGKPFFTRVNAAVNEIDNDQVTAEVLEVSSESAETWRNLEYCIGGDKIHDARK
jgi:hypothetical protein